MVYMYDKSDCVSSGGGLVWTCTVVGSASWDQDPFSYHNNGSSGVNWAGANCETDPAACRFAAGGIDSGSAESRDLSTCDPFIDPDCEQALPDSMKTRIVNAMAQYVKTASMISDPALRARCQEMVDRANLYLAANAVYLGAKDTPLMDPGSHYGAYSPRTGNIHFDPWAMNSATSGSNVAWQVANTMLHEAAHTLGYNHDPKPMVIPYRGRTPVYSEPYFADLNPGGERSCMKP